MSWSPLHLDEVTVSAASGASIDLAVAFAIMLAQDMRCAVTLVFNDVPMHITGTTTVDAAVASWNETRDFLRKVTHR